ncbi:phenylacetate--CoA ligase family protein [Zhouia amylolytica]|uniref:phenylacetate--CoA ligase family protein n=1 Tax=Zhouia amylolytica TaxID=376730 RepID=UPI0004AF45BE|nr:phenylacetate--CoA ligase family protein [Zhouia amylolytica]
MDVFKNFRKNCLWIYDFLKGGAIRKHYREIKIIFDGEESNIEIPHIINDNLNKLIVHAITSVTHYKQYSDAKSLQDFKVINKNIIRESYADFISDKFDKSDLQQVYTSGSTGTPFKVLQDKNKKNRNAADTLFFAEKAGYTTGEKLYYLRHWDQYNTRGKLETWLKNIVMHPVSKLTDKDIDKLISDIKNEKGNVNIISYASALEKIASYIDRQEPPKADFKVTSILSIAEGISDRAREIISDYFGTQLISRYSNVENGILSQEIMGKGQEYYINTASFIVEILDFNEDRPLPDGCLGRIVITDLFNYAMPMIRYDTGDLGVMESKVENDINYFVLKKVEGRRADMIFNTKGQHISSYVVYHLLKYPHIHQYQFIQNDVNQYTFKFKVSAEFNSEDQIKNEFKIHLGNDAQINFEYVDDIPLLSSGKRKVVVNKIPVN